MTEIWTILVKNLTFLLANQKILRVFVEFDLRNRLSGGVKKLLVILKSYIDFKLPKWVILEVYNVKL